MYYKTERAPISVAIVASIAIHAIAFSLIWASLIKDRGFKNEPVLFAELVPNFPLKPIEPKKVEKQIVAPPNKTEEQNPNPKRIFESDQDNSSIKEQIRRGEDGNNINLAQQTNEKESRNSKPMNKVANQPVQKNEVSKAVEKKIEAKNNDQPLELKLNPDSLAEISSSNKKDAAKVSADEKLQQEIQSSLQKNERSAVNVSRLGSRDYINDIPDGEVTLLNTKANKYAVFVRRVASQVFANLRGAGWRSLSAADIRSITKDGVFEAVLSPKGDLLSVSLQSASDSQRFDQVLKLAIQKGAKDPNPPPGAEAEDGNIHFTFQAKSWVQYQSNPRSGIASERRWLVLATGLE